MFKSLKTSVEKNADALSNNNKRFSKREKKDIRRKYQSTEIEGFFNFFISKFEFF